ncbi:APC family permease [Mycoplasmopsis iners]|uniref:APC family permease n=1 Tax=Mycoplasmopsis iners TaxID=76630 RepID=UPI000495B01A|nr:APC family permease [Mycoplasmopsis iners]
MNNTQETKFVQEPSKQKKISFFSAMLIVIGGSIGAGIFFKSGGVLSNSQGSIVLAAFAWIIASLAVVTMGLALIEIASVRNDNLSLISWTKIFNGRIIYNATKNFMVYIYLPLTYFFMPLYVIMSLQDGMGALLNKAAVFGTQADWLIWTVISLVMSIYFLTVPALWSKVGDIQNKVVTYIKFIPLAFVAIIGYVLKATGSSDAVITASTNGTKEFGDAIKAGSSLTELYGIGAGLGMFLAISAIFFAYDGFYVAAGISSEMKEPKKTPMALLLGLLITTGIYLLIAISMSINGGSFWDMQSAMAKLFKNETAARIIFGIMNIAIAIGVLGIINGFSMWAPRYVEDLIAEGEVPFWRHFYKKLNPNKPLVGVIYSLVLTIPVVLVFTLIGALAYLPNIADYGGYSQDARYSMARLYAFADLMANWTALFTFAFIACAIAGAIKNKKTNRIHINQTVKGFKVYAYISSIIIFAALAVTVLVPIIDMFLLAGIADKSSTAFTDTVVSRVMLVLTLFVYVALSFLPLVIEDALHKKQYGSLKKYEEEKAKILAAK